jgi:hypothetical protein
VVRCIAILVGCAFITLGVVATVYTRYDSSYAWFIVYGFLLILPWSKIRRDWLWRACFTVTLLPSIWVVPVIFISNGITSSSSDGWGRRMQGSLIITATLFIIVMHPIVLINIRRKSKEPNQTPEPTAPSGRGSS